MCVKPGQVFSVAYNVEFFSYSNQLLCSAEDLMFNRPFFAGEFIFAPIDNRAVHPAVIIALAGIIKVGVIIGIARFIAIK